MDKREKEEVENIREEAASLKNPAGQPNQEEKEATVEVDEAEATTQLKEELESAKDKYIRLYSEFENFRRRTAKEKLELIQSANEQLIKSLLPIADDFERAENASQDKTSSDMQGFLLIYSKFRKVLETYGAKPMDAGQGSDFNPDFHDAITQIQAPAAELKGKIVEVIEKGYLLNDKVIRYAKVVVGN